MTMEVIYVHESPVSVPKTSIFLAGPSPREKTHYDWRPEALSILEEMKYDGRVFVPLPRDGIYLKDYDHDAQATWEVRWLEISSVRAFWVPRSAELPGFTTNVEYGLFVRDSGRMVLGYPEGATKMRYLNFLARRYGVPVFSTLRETLQEAVIRANKRKDL